MVNSANQIPNEWRKYNTQTPQGLEIVTAVLYDTVSYVSGTSVSLTFFNTVRATLDLGNLTQAGLLPSPSSFLIRGLRFYVKGRPFAVTQVATGTAQTGAAEDIAQLINTGILSITIGQKQYGPFPLWMLPSGGGALAVTSGVTVNNQIATNGNPDARACYSLTKPLVIAPMINFSAAITWPSAITLAQGNTNIEVVFDGDLARPIQ